MEFLKFLAVLVIIFAEFDFGADGIAVDLDLRMSPEQKKIMDKVSLRNQH